MITLEKNTIKYKTVNNQEQNFLINLNTERGSVVIENIIKQSHLTEQDRNNYELELNALNNIVTHPALNKLLITNIENCVDIKESVQLVKEISDYLISQNISVDLLSYLVPTYSKSSYEYNTDIIIGMKPNKWFPTISSLALKENYDKIIGADNSEYRSHIKIEKELKDEETKLLTCKDKDFIKEALKPFKDKLNKSKVKNKDLLKEIENNKELFNQYLEKQNLKQDFDQLKINEKRNNNVLIDVSGKMKKLR